MRDPFRAETADQGAADAVEQGVAAGEDGDIAAGKGFFHCVQHGRQRSNVNQGAAQPRHQGAIATGDGNGGAAAQQGPLLGG